MTGRDRDRRAPGDAGRPRPAGRPRRRGPRKITLALAAVIALLALAVGLVAGALVSGDGSPSPLRTTDQEIRVVTVTPGR